jgi:DNA-binding transcriptional LysR family regulator
MELRQLQYFISLAEELHFGRAARREHIVQSALSQQIQHLEHELGVRLADRDTHHVQLTRAGHAFLAEARQVLTHADRAARAARRGSRVAPTLRAGICDPSYDSLPQILRRAKDRDPDLEIHQVETGVPQQVRMLLDGRLDVGFGRAANLPVTVASELVRLDPIGVLMAADHHLAGLPSVPIAALGETSLLMVEQARAPEFNDFLAEMYRSAGLVPTYYRGTVASICGAQALIAQGSCALCVPASGIKTLAGLVWKPLTEPISLYPWSLLWRSSDPALNVRAVVASARTLGAEHGWVTSRSPGYHVSCSPGTTRGDLAAPRPA